MKPHIRYEPMFDSWFCSSYHYIGGGHTPRQAYCSWEVEVSTSEQFLREMEQRLINGTGTAEAPVGLFRTVGDAKPHINVIRTGVRFDSPCPAAPDDGWEWTAVIVHEEWRLLRGMRKQSCDAGLFHTKR